MSDTVTLKTASDFGAKIALLEAPGFEIELIQTLNEWAVFRNRLRTNHSLYEEVFKVNRASYKDQHDGILILLQAAHYGKRITEVEYNRKWEDRARLQKGWREFSTTYYGWDIYTRLINAYVDGYSIDSSASTEE